MDDRDIARWRMHTLRLWGPPHAAPTDVIEGLLGVQAENHPQASWAVAARTRKADATSMAEGFDEGAWLRTHVLRPTWHYVRPEDIRWLLELTGPRFRRSFDQLRAQLDLADATVDTALATIEGALADGTHLTREAIGERLAAEGLPGSGQSLAVIMAEAELAALVCSGVMAAGQQTYALLAERAPDARRPDRDEAVAEVVRRYFTGHGPATAKDLSYWATMTLTDIKAGIAAAGDQLEHLEVGGRTYWFGTPPPPDDAPDRPRAHLLQVLDEYHNGYQDSRYVLDVAGIVPRQRQPSVGMVLVDSQMVGGMRRTIRTDAVHFAVSTLRDLDPSEVAALDDAAQRYGRFLDLDAHVDIART